MSTQHSDGSGPAITTTVTSVEQATPTTKLFTLSVPGKFDFKAGQWLDVFLPGVDTVGGFSIANAPDKDAASHDAGVGSAPGSTEVHVAIKYAEWPPAQWMHQTCKVGSTMDIRVGGTVFVDQVAPDDRYLFIAGGIGISPLHGMIQRVMAAPGGTGRVSLLYSAKHSAELLFKGAFDAMAANGPRFTPSYFLTDALPPDGTESESGTGGGASSGGPVGAGRMDDADLDAALRGLGEEGLGLDEKLHVHMCGPPAMLDAIEAQLLAKGLKPEQIHFERWW